MDSDAHGWARDAFAFLKPAARLVRVADAYTKVYGPSSAPKDEPYVAISANGSVCFASPIGEHIGAQKRPDPPVMLSEHPLGADIGPGYGRFVWGISHADVVSRFPKRSDLANAVISAFAKAGIAW